MLSDAGLYVHFPWCVKKCPYCDFNSHPVRGSIPGDRYMSCLVEDWRQQSARWSSTTTISSVFLGGGTPSLFSPDLIVRALRELPLSESAEITMEANPGTTEHADFTGYFDIGINRLSLGAQSFDSDQLKALGRIHSGQDTQNAFQQARKGGFNNINLDVMWGLPQQSVDQALADLQTAINLDPEHISWYQLTLEAKTEFARRPPTLPVDSVMADIERHGNALLADAGYQRYEVSAYAKPHRQCQHNLNYWQFGDYIGIGAGAHGKRTETDQVLRTRKDSQPRLYMDRPTRIHQTPIASDALNAEFMLNALRLVEGVSFATFEQRTQQPWSKIADKWQRLADLQLVQADRCAATKRGFELLDSVIAEFV